MKNEELFKKYKDGNHWDNHPIDYIKQFAIFLNRDSLKQTRNFFSGKIIDLGCGSGRDVEFLIKECNLRAIGLDKDPNIIEKIIEKTGYIFAFETQNIEKLKFKDNTQYAYFCINVMHYVDQEKVIGEIYRTLKPGGYAFIHFNLAIFDAEYNFDYIQNVSNIYDLIRLFEIVEEDFIVREDSLPILHTHLIMQVILKKQ